MSNRNNNNQNNRQHKDQSNLRVCALSGTDEVGRNCSIVEYGDSIVLVDCGLAFPEQELYGVDYMIPNRKYLIKNKHKIKGILITHGHLDHTGALPYILPEIDFPPVYGGKFANALIKERLKEFNLEKKTRIIDIERASEQIQLGDFKINFIGVTHSIPSSFSIFVESPKGNVFFSGDYKIDRNPLLEEEMDYSRFQALQGKVDLALMESTNAEESGQSVAESEVHENIEKIVKERKGRVVISSFASSVSRLHIAIEIAKKTNRKLFISGRSWRNAFKIANDLGYVKAPQHIMEQERNVNNFPDNKVLFLCTGSQGERYGALNRMALGEHRHFHVKKGDLIIKSSSNIPGNEIQIENMTDQLIRRGADLITNDMETIHSSGHGKQIDMKIMYEMIKPKSIMPIHGSMTMRYMNEKLLMRLGMPRTRIYLTEDGQFWDFQGQFWAKSKKVESKPILIDGLGVGDVGEIVLKDRQQLAEYGMFIVILKLSSQNKKLVGKPKFVSRGFVYVKASQQLFNELEQKVKGIHSKWRQKTQKHGKYKINDLKKDIDRELSKYIYKKIEREPMIMTVIV